MDKNSTKLIIKLDYNKVADAEKFLSLIENNNISISKICIDEYSIIIK